MDLVGRSTSREARFCWYIKFETRIVIVKCRVAWKSGSVEVERVPLQITAGRRGTR